jgi:hypothetical protein
VFARVLRSNVWEEGNRNTTIDPKVVHCIKKVRDFALLDLSASLSETTADSSSMQHFASR